MLRLLALLALAPLTAAAADIVIGLDGEFGHRTSTSAQAVERGAAAAIAELNAAGGVLGRRLRLEVRDHRGVPARAADDFAELAGIPGLVAVLQAKFSTTAQAQLPLAERLRIPLVLTWSTAESLIDNGQDPNWVFRVSTSDRQVFGALVARAVAGGRRHPGLLAPSNAWGRSGAAAAEQAAGAAGVPLSVAWYPFGATTLAAPFRRLREEGADILLLQANEGEGAVLVRELSALPAEERLPILAHWGITGGNFVELCGAALADIDLAVVQTFTFAGPLRPRGAALLDRLRAGGWSGDPAAIPSPVGIAHAYDAVHLVALAVAAAGGSDAALVRDALERLPAWSGAVRDYAPAFSRGRHEAFADQPLFFCRFADGDRLLRAGGGP